MIPLRRLVLRHPLLAGWLVALTLAMKLLVPAGFMPMVSGHSITISICSGYAPMPMAMPGMKGHANPDGHHDRTVTPCAFGELTMPGLAGADPVLLAAALVFILALGFMILAVRARKAPSRLRPPAIGPPITA